MVVVIAGSGPADEMSKYMKIHRFPLKIMVFEQNGGILGLVDGPGGVYGGTWGV